VARSRFPIGKTSEQGFQKNVKIVHQNDYQLQYAFLYNDELFFVSSIP